MKLDRTSAEVIEAVRDILAGYTEDIKFKGESDDYWYAQGIATEMASNYEAGETVSIRIHKNAELESNCELDEWQIEGFALTGNDAKWIWLNSIYD